MKNYWIIAVLVLAFVAMVAPVSAQPKVESGISFYTFQHVQYMDGDENADLKRSRLKFFPTDTSVKFSWYGEFDLAGLDDDGLKGTNWLQQVWGGWRFDGVEVRVGRIFAGPAWSTYFPGGFYTSRYPGVYPFGLHFWGTQLFKESSKNRFILDLGSRSGGNFDDSDCLEEFEMGVHYRRKFAIGFVDFAAQGGDEFVRTGVQLDVVKGRIGLTGGVFHTNEDQARDLTGLVTVRTRVLTVREAQMFVVGQQEWRGNGSSPYTLGAATQLGNFFLVVDHEEGTGWGTRLQYSVKMRL